MGSLLRLILYINSTRNSRRSEIISHFRPGTGPVRLIVTRHTPKYMTLADSEWLECLLYVTVLRFAILPSVIFFLLIYCKVCLRSGTARDPHRSAGSEFRIVIHRIFGIGETLHRQNVNKYRQNIVLVLRSISTDSKHCLIDICVKFCFAPICLEL